MSVTPSQLSEIHNELVKSFIADPTISITPTKGDPPDQYDISYQIGGMSLSDSGDIRESFGHTISLTIPFGFPHFPPSCKPKSNIFHPDFDPAAICIGNFWEQNQSLPELIVSIGRMINGEIYSTSNVFNEEAGDWYTKHPEKFPLSDISWGAGFDFDAAEPQQTVDTLDDSDLSTDFNFYEMDIDNEDEISISNSFPEVDAEPSPKIESTDLHLLRKQKKYFKIQQTLKGSTRSSDELLQLSEKSSNEIKKAKKFYAQAKKQEKQGDARKSLELFEKTAATVSDFPTIDGDIQRLKQALTFLDDFSPDAAEFPDTAIKDLNASGDAARHQKVPGPKRSGHRSHFEKTRNPKIQLFAVGVVLLALGTGAGYFWFSANQNLAAAEQAALTCESFLQENKFTEGKNACEQGLTFLNKIKFIKQTDAKAIRGSLTTILQSERLLQGIAGNVMYDGEYISKAEAEQQKVFNAALQTATNAYENEEWLTAIASYKKLLDLTSSRKLITSITKEEINQHIAFCSFRINFTKAEKLMEGNKWDDALAQFESTKPLLTTLPPEIQTFHSERLQLMYSQCKFNSLKEKGDIAFADSRWQEASAFYSDALNSYNQKDQILPETVDIIKSNNQRAQLYKTITEGNQAFASADWDAAIAAYNQADSYLTKNPGLLSQDDYDLSRKKLARIGLQATIIRDQQRAEIEITDKNLKKAKTTYASVIENIDKSVYGREDQFAQSREDFVKKIKELDKEIELEEKITYLTENYESLFIANYPASNKENLTNPLITFAKEAGDKVVFRMQCSETGRGRPLILVMFYAYDKNRKSWSLFSDQ